MSALPSWKVPRWAWWSGWYDSVITLEVGGDQVEAQVLENDGDDGAVNGLVIHPCVRATVDGKPGVHGTEEEYFWLSNQWTITHRPTGTRLVTTPMRPMVAMFAAYTLRDMVEKVGLSWDVLEDEITDTHKRAVRQVAEVLQWASDTDYHVEKLTKLAGG